MNIKETYEFWCSDSYFDADTKAELKKIENNAEEIEERFYKNLAFGTGGLRGIIGAGTNRINIYTVRKATQGLANYINRERNRRASRLLMIPEICRRNLQRKRRCAWRQTE